MYIACLVHWNQVFIIPLAPKCTFSPFQCHSCPFLSIPVPFLQIPAHSCGFLQIPVEWVHSYRNRWGMVKYCLYLHLMHNRVLHAYNKSILSHARSIPQSWCWRKKTKLRTLITYHYPTAVMMSNPSHTAVTMSSCLQCLHDLKPPW